MRTQRRIIRVAVMSVVLTFALGAPAAYGGVTLADSYPDSNSEAMAAINSAYPQAGQSFTAIAGTLDSVTFDLYRDPLAAGEAHALLYAHSGTFGVSSIPSGAPLATSSPVDVATISDIDLSPVTFRFDNTVSLAAGQKYVIAVRYDDSATENVWFGLDNNAPTHPGNHVYRDATAWEPVSTFDAVFSVYETPPAPVPVYRFYNAALGTHFYTASATEKATVLATLGHIYTLEGEAYRMIAAANTTQLHRFYRPATGTHFYTASATEKADVQARLSHIYTYEGLAYNVSAAPAAGRIAVYRFYNTRNGTHFYTASATEKANVEATLSHIYTYEGPAFYIGQVAP